MKRHYCTYFDRNYLVKGLSLIQSLGTQDRSNFTLFVVCLDEITRLLVEKIAPPNVVPVPLHAVEHGNDALAIARGNRTLVEYYWTLTPTVISWLFERYHDIGTLLYLDSDLYFFNAPDPVWAEMDLGSILIQPHRFSPELLHHERFGIYNVGLVGFRRDDDGLKVLDWWRRQCLEWCYSRVEDGRYADQLYLNRFPDLSQRVHPLSHIGGGVAPWNHTQYTFRLNGKGRPMVDGQELIFYHFHSLAVFEPEIIVPLKYTANRLTEPLLQHVFVPYADALGSAVARVRKIQRGFKFGVSDTCVPGTEHTFLARPSQRVRIADSRVPQRRISLTEDWDAYVSKQFVYQDAPKRQSAGRNGKKMINLGCGHRFHPDWINVDFTSSGPDVIAYNLLAGIPFGDEALDVVYHSNMLEHFPKRQANAFIGECFRVLKPGGMLRVAVPDLEQVVRWYLQLLDGALAGDRIAAERYEWIIIELIDQMTRNHSGGEMFEYWKQRPVPAKDFVIQRVGPEIERTLEALARRPMPLEPADDIYYRAAVGKNGADISKMASFRLGGEVHQWMYDRYSLGRLLTGAGFVDIRSCSAHDSDIPGFASYHLDVEVDGRVRKPDSLYMEARKPGKQERAKERKQSVEAKGMPPGRGEFGSDLRLDTAKAPESLYNLYKEIQRLLDSGKKVEAMDGLKMLLTMHPGFALAHNDLALLYYEEGEKDKALIHYEQAVRIEPDNLIFQKNLADFHYVALGQVDDALEHYARALSCNPGDINTLLMLGHLSVSKGKFNEAAIFYRKVLERDAENGDARDKLDLLAKLDKGDFEIETVSDGSREDDRASAQISPINAKGNCYREMLWFEWIMIDACNLNCRYCVNGYGKTLKGEAQSKPAALDLKMAEQIVGISQHAEKVFVNLTGGEPTLSKHIVEIIYLLCQTQNISVQLITNMKRMHSLAQRLEPCLPLIHIVGSLHVSHRTDEDMDRMIGFINGYKSVLNIQLTQVNHEFSKQDMEKLTRVKNETGLNIALQTYIPPRDASARSHSVRDASFVSSLGKRCCLGYSTFLLQPDGIFRYGLWCSRKETADFVTIKPSDFRAYMLDGMEKCPKTSCDCNYNTFIYDSYLRACRRLGYREEEIFGPDNVRKNEA